MTVKVNEQDLVWLYNKAKQKYKDCINNKDNNFLESEINVPLESVSLIEKEIKIVFSRHVFNNMFFHVSLALFAAEREIGLYIYIENQDGSEMDDSLVFY